LEVDDEALRERFRQWLAGRWPDAEELSVGAFESPKSGFSARTLFAPLRYRRNGAWQRDRVVLRIESPDPAIYPAQAPGLDVEVELQYRVMEAVAKSGRVPVARLLGYEPDPSALGQPFFVMEHVEGEVAAENPPYTQQGFFAHAGPAARKSMVEQGLQALAALHTLDWKAAGLEWLVAPGATPGLEAQLELWERFGRCELGERVHPVFDAGIAWLRAHLPPPAESGFSWGDCRLGNLIFRNGRLACVTDFENAAIAPPEMDLGWWLMFDRTQHEWVNAPRLPGEPSREEQRDFYARCSGRDVGDTHPWEVFGAIRYTAIVVRVMNRAVERGFLPPDQQIWLRNPASDTLADLLGTDRP
jgi:aminoglycoside phosphotransferase (APT) family kinase protein